MYLQPSIPPNPQDLALAYRKAKVDLYYMGQPCSEKLVEYEQDLSSRLENLQQQIATEENPYFSSKDFLGGYTVVPHKLKLDDSKGTDSKSSFVESDPWKRWRSSVEKHPFQWTAEFRLMAQPSMNLVVFSTYTIEFMGIWERVNNPDFNLTEFSYIKIESGSNGFVLSSKQWIEKTHAVGVVAQAGRYGGTYAHKDIAFEFAPWISLELKFYFINEFQRLKQEEQKLLGWNLQRTLSKINYLIHTDAIKENLIPPQLSPHKVGLVYATDADLLNTALFGITAKEWREANPDKKGNIRDEATIEQLVVLSILESINAMLIHQGHPQGQRIVQLNTMVITQMKSLLSVGELQKKLENHHD
jgi:hypothetical protein